MQKSTENVKPPASNGPKPKKPATIQELVAELTELAKSATTRSRESELAKESIKALEEHAAMPLPMRLVLLPVIAVAAWGALRSLSVGILARDRHLETQDRDIADLNKQIAMTLLKVDEATGKSEEYARLMSSAQALQRAAEQRARSGEVWKDNTTHALRHIRSTRPLEPRDIIDEVDRLRALFDQAIQLLEHSGELADVVAEIKSKRDVQLR